MLAVPAAGVGAAYLNGDKFNNLTAAPLTVSYTVVPVSAGGCLGAPKVVVMTVSPEPVLSGSLNLTQCSDIATALTLNTNGTSVAAQNYNITNLTIACWPYSGSRKRHRTRPAASISVTLPMINLPIQVRGISGNVQPLFR